MISRKLKEASGGAGSPESSSRGGALLDFTEIGAQGSIRGAAWPGRTIAASIIYWNRLCGVAVDGARRVAEEAALHGRLTGAARSRYSGCGSGRGLPIEVARNSTELLGYYCVATHGGRPPPWWRSPELAAVHRRSGVPPT